MVFLSQFKSQVKIVINLRSRLIILLLVIGVLATTALTLNTTATNMQQHNVKPLTELTETGILVEIDNYGFVDLTVGVVGDNIEEIPIINLHSSDTYYNKICAISIDLVRGPDEYTQLIIKTFGDTTSDTGVNAYVNSIKDAILNTFDLNMNEEDHMTVYDGTVTNYFWEYSLVDSENKIYTGIQNFANNVISSPINSLTNLYGHLNFTRFDFYMERDDCESTFSLIYMLRATVRTFEGEGTHTFSLAQILGVSSLPTGTDYSVYILLPSGATIDETTINAGDATYYVTESQLVVMVSSSTSISDISFNFTYTFETPTSSGGSGSSGGETEDNSTSSGTTGGEPFSSSSMVYIGGTIAVIAIVGIIARIFLRGRH